MIENTVRKHLKTVLSVAVYAVIPENPKEEYILVTKAGSNQENHIDSAMIVVKSHAMSQQAAAQLNERVKAAMSDLIRLNNISSCKLNTDYNSTDTASKRYRYHAVFDITHY